MAACIGPTAGRQQGDRDHPDANPAISFDGFNKLLRQSLSISAGLESSRIKASPRHRGVFVPGVLTVTLGRTWQERAGTVSRNSTHKQIRLAHRYGRVTAHEPKGLAVSFSRKKPALGVGPHGIPREAG